MLHFYVINLERSKERWKKFTKNDGYSEEFFTRVKAVEGANLSKIDNQSFDVGLFQRYNGRFPKPGEIGCYLSHLRAIKEFYNSEHECAVIFEDDIEFGPEQLSFCHYLKENMGTGPLMFRLETNRKPAFESLFSTPTGISIGHCWFGPTGGAAVYWINKEAAKKLIKAMDPGFLPVDTMFERAWYHSVPTFVTHPSVFPHPTPPFSEIGRDDGVKYKKYTPLKRIPTLLFRAKEFFKRLAYCTRMRSIPR